MTVTHAPSFTSLALRDQPPPDWADVVVETIPVALAGLVGPRAVGARDLLGAAASLRR